MASILLVEDDPAIANLVRFVLQDAGFLVCWVLTGEEGLTKFRAAPYDLLILDIGLPGRNGYDVCVEVRHESNVPVMMLTALARPEDAIRGLEAGADDYLTKPFSPRTLIARIRRLIERSDPSPELTHQPLQIGDLTIDLQRGQVTRAGQMIPLAHAEARLLHCLALRPGEVVSSRLLLHEMLGDDRREQGTEAIVHTCVCHLRSKLEPEPGRPRYLVDVRGLGYRLQV